MTHPALIERITRSLAYMLRHQPEEFDLEVDEYGFADLEDVVRALNERLGEPVDDEDVREAVTSGDRQRYEITDDRIRALYGHSIDVQPGEPSKPPAELYVGVSRDDAERARRYGLRAGRRRFLHLALTQEDALESGRRTSRDYVVIKVHALDAWEDGINFYDRTSLFLSDPIPTDFLEVGDVHTDGYGDEHRGGGHGDERRGRQDSGRSHERSQARSHGSGHSGGHPAGRSGPPARQQEAFRGQRAAEVQYEPAQQRAAHDQPSLYENSEHGDAEHQGQHEAHAHGEALEEGDSGSLSGPHTGTGEPSHIVEQPPFGERGGERGGFRGGEPGRGRGRRRGRGRGRPSGDMPHESGAPHEARPPSGAGAQHGSSSAPYSGGSRERFAEAPEPRAPEGRGPEGPRREPRYESAPPGRRDDRSARGPQMDERRETSAHAGPTHGGQGGHGGGPGGQPGRGGPGGRYDERRDPSRPQGGGPRGPGGGRHDDRPRREDRPRPDERRPDQPFRDERRPDAFRPAEPRYGDSRSGEQRPGAEHRNPEPRHEPRHERPESRPGPRGGDSSSDSFGVGVQDPRGEERRRASTPPRTSPPPHVPQPERARPKPPEPAKREPDDSGFGAGVL